MNRLILTAVVAVFLSACGSAVKLDNVPVEDKSGSSVSQTGMPGGSGVGERAVAGVDIDKSNASAAMQASESRSLF